VSGSDPLVVRKYDLAANGRFRTVDEFTPPDTLEAQPYGRRAGDLEGRVAVDERGIANDDIRVGRALNRVATVFET